MKKQIKSIKCGLTGFKQLKQAAQSKKICQIKKSKHELQAGFTIEAAVIVPIILILTFCVTFAAFFLHDSTVIKAVNTDVSVKNKGEKNADESEMSAEIQQKIEESLLMIDVEHAELSQDEGSKEFNAMISASAAKPKSMAEKILPVYFDGIEYELKTANTNARQTLNGYKAFCDGLSGTELADELVE